VKDWLDRLGEILLETIRLESSAAGKVNVLGTIGALGIIGIGSGLLDFWQAIVRVLEPEYTTGLPSAVPLFILFFSALLLCVGMLAFIEKHRS
jgi:hypothetical protein